MCLCSRLWHNRTGSELRRKSSRHKTRDTVQVSVYSTVHRTNVLSILVFSAHLYIMYISLNKHVDYCSEDFYSHTVFLYPWVQFSVIMWGFFHFLIAALACMISPDPTTSKQVFLADGFTCNSSSVKFWLTVILKSKMSTITHLIWLLGCVLRKTFVQERRQLHFFQCKSICFKTIQE